MSRLCCALVLSLAAVASPARAQGPIVPPIGTPPGDAKVDRSPVLPNQQFQKGVPSLFGQGGTNQFYTPVGPSGSRANVMDAPPGGLAGRQSPASQTPSLWQRFKNFFGLGDSPAPGTVPQQLANPSVFGGR